MNTNNNQKKKSKFAIFVVIWRFLLCLWIPIFYFLDTFEHILIESNYADGEDWSWERTKVDILRLWYKY